MIWCWGHLEFCTTIPNTKSTPSKQIEFKSRISNKLNEIGISNGANFEGCSALDELVKAIKLYGDIMLYYVLGSVAC
jgi:hypothetical protein